MKRDYSRKQIELILNQIILFEQKKTEIGSLIGSIEFLLSNLEEADDISSFWREWGRLEEYYSVRITEKMGKIDLENQEVKESILNLKKLSQNWLSSYVKQVDKSVLQTAKVLGDNWLMCPECLEAWESISEAAMVICPKCNSSLQNPCYKKTK